MLNNSRYCCAVPTYLQHDDLFQSCNQTNKEDHDSCISTINHIWWLQLKSPPCRNQISRMLIVAARRCCRDRSRLSICAFLHCICSRSWHVKWIMTRPFLSSWCNSHSMLMIEALKSSSQPDLKQGYRSSCTSANSKIKATYLSEFHLKCWFSISQTWFVLTARRDTLPVYNDFINLTLRKCINCVITHSHIASFLILVDPIALRAWFHYGIVCTDIKCLDQSSRSLRRKPQWRRAADILQNLIKISFGKCQYRREVPRCNEYQSQNYEKISTPRYRRRAIRRRDWCLFKYLFFSPWSDLR